VFVDANESLAVILERLTKPGDLQVRVHRDPDIAPGQLPDVLDGAEIAIVDHTALPTAIARNCAGLKHVVFLGTGARSYMNPEELAELGIEVHLIKGYGDPAVAESTMALIWAAARGIAEMDREMRAGNWLRDDGMQLKGKTLGLIGFGGIAAEVARIASGSGLRVIAWNRSPRSTGRTVAPPGTRRGATRRPDGPPPLPQRARRSDPGELARGRRLPDRAASTRPRHRVGVPDGRNRRVATHES